MRHVLTLLISSILATSANAVTLIGNNPDINDGGLTVAPGDWTKVGGGPDARVEDNRNGPDGGDWAVGGSDGSGSSAPYDTYYFQNFDVNTHLSGPGLYDVDLSGWVKVWAGWWSGENWDWLQEAHIELYVDGNLIVDLEAVNNSEQWDTWLHRCFKGKLQINSDIEVRLRSIKGNDQFGTGSLGAIWYDSRFDDIRLEATPAVPFGPEVFITHNPEKNDGGLNVEPSVSAWSYTSNLPADTLGNDVAQVVNDRSLLCPDSDDGGNWAVGGGDGSGASPPQDNYYAQTFPAASLPSGAGNYDIELRGWVHAWAGWHAGEDFNFVQEAHIELWIDGVQVADLAALNQDPAQRDKWLFREYCNQHTINDQIEVRLHTIKGNDQFGSGNLGAVFFNSRYDDVELLLKPPVGCTDPTTISLVTPSEFLQPPDLGIETVSIEGTNLDVSTVIYLTGPATIPAQNLNIISSTQIEVDFDLSDAPYGSYDLVIDRDCPCNDAVAENALEVGCIAPAATLDAVVTGDVTPSSASGHVLTLSGTNLDGLTDVMLVKSNNNDTASEISASSLTMNGQDLEATFTLFSAEAGYYDVVAVHPCDLVNGPLTRAVIVYVPELTNGSFEEGYKPDLTGEPVCVDPGVHGDRPKAMHWDAWSTTLEPEAFGHARDGSVWVPTCEDEQIQNISGQHYNGVSIGGSGPVTIGFFQTMAAPNIDGTHTTTAPFNIRAEFAINGGLSSGRIRLIDGTPDNPAQEWTTTIPSEFPADSGLVADAAYNAVVPQGVTYLSDPPTLTVLLDFTNQETGTFGYWVDNVRSGSFVPPDCATIPIVFDVDGDGDVDQKDFAAFQRCIGITPVPEECRCLNRDTTGASADVIDGADFAIFLNCALGPDVPADPACDD